MEKYVFERVICVTSAGGAKVTFNDHHSYFAASWLFRHTFFHCAVFALTMKRIYEENS